MPVPSSTTPGPHVSGPHVVVLPGTGSDEVFARRVFGPAVAELDGVLHAPRPASGSALVRELLTALDTAASRTAAPLLVGGVSLGAHVAAEWALRNAERCAGVLAVLPAWNASPDDHPGGPAGAAPAATAARASADLIERHGLEEALRLSTDGVPAWLADELSRAWRRHGDGLAAGLRTAAGHAAPTLEQLRGCRVPVGIVACVDDPVHPVSVARAWAEALPHARVHETTLAAFGADPALAGRAAAAAWRAAADHRSR
ncbi:thioesterase [Saccharomonospora sp. CUA-673]|uniref:alpha/beta fold hydrolase n=1 Tax=Saccharomonospora sp. CUA-673 TaxID=1904969 RepID=UPI000966D686|nr:alpha/beta hydrolase [Saccharomonospora sp. CUA-673]OLT43210.1 thioesterase [Saccharomonospora sp. CUA-673]